MAMSRSKNQGIETAPTALRWRVCAIVMRTTASGALQSARVERRGIFWPVKPGYSASIESSTTQHGEAFDTRKDTAQSTARLESVLRLRLDWNRFTRTTCRHSSSHADSCDLPLPEVSLTTSLGGQWRYPSGLDANPGTVHLRSCHNPSHRQIMAQGVVESSCHHIVLISTLVGQP